MQWFRMSLGDGKPPPVEWWKMKTVTGKGSPREGWPEVLEHVFFSKKPVSIERAYMEGGARLIYYCIGGDGRVVAVANVRGKPELLPEPKPPFKWRVPVRITGPKCPCDASAPQLKDFHKVKVGPGPFARLPEAAGELLAEAISEACSGAN